LIIYRKGKCFRAFTSLQFLSFTQNLIFLFFMATGCKAIAQGRKKGKKNTGAYASEYLPVIEQGGKRDEERSQKSIVAASGAEHGACVCQLQR
ncbi:MAG TPA: hypothetical protein VN512_07295, partial [Clostridia bacterium]|nr:hypothetical protein [Clostridia bacterium]